MLSTLHDNTRSEDIAIVGLACRFPGARNYHEFWDNLIEGRNCIVEIPEDRWDWKTCFGDPEKGKNKTRIKWGGFIEDMDKFDPLFFNMSPKEAGYIDPQHRLFLESAWHAIEDAGYDPDSLSGGNIGVYAGVSKNDYAELMREKQESIISFVSTGTVHSILANRVSFLLNFRGKSEVVDTASSSVMAALFNAVRDIRLGICEAAVVGGVNALLTPTMYISHGKAGMLSEDGACKAFDAQADGYVRGEGVGVIFIKPLKQARQDRDHIMGVIKGIAVQHGGRSNTLTSPKASAQASVISAALQDAGVDPRTIGYIEAHGTGTPIGDPVEIDALKAVYGPHIKAGDKPHCGIGSVKTHIGHLESAAGIAGLIKILLSFKYHKIPAMLHFNRLNPDINLNGSPFFIVERHCEWKRQRQNGKGAIPLRAGLSSFGMGGVNAHLILEEPPRESHGKRSPAEREAYLIPLSAKTKECLIAYAASLRSYLESGEKPPAMNDIAYTLQTGRAAMRHRVLFLSKGLRNLINLLRHFIEGREKKKLIFAGKIEEDIKPNKPALDIKKDNWRVIARQWVRGNPVNWQNLYRDMPGYKIPLPVYPFQRMRCWFLPPAPHGNTSTLSQPIEPSDGCIRNQNVEAFLKELLSDPVGLPPNQIESDVSLDAYGINSMMISDLNSRLTDIFGNLPKTLFFEYRNVRELAAYFEKNHTPVLRQKLVADASAQDVAGKIPMEKGSRSLGKKELRGDSDMLMARPDNCPDHLCASPVLDDDIAIIGVGGRYPMARTLEQFWENLKQGKDCITEIPASRFDHGAFYAPGNTESDLSAKWGGFIDDIDLFDPLLFNISPREADLIDPQERLFLQVVWETLEDAGYTRTALKERAVGVFVGAWWQPYTLLGVEQTCRGNLQNPSGLLYSIPNRVSFFFDWSGPSLAIDTACSSSLTALHFACESLRRGECRSAIAGGVNLSLGASKYLWLSHNNFLSSDGKCRSFGSGGDGYVPGEGVGAVCLKRLADALRDGDRIDGVIKATSVNHGGRTNGYTIPNPNRQGDLILSALNRSGVTPDQISYVEAHGTGTSLGDPIEIRGLQKAFSKFTDAKAFCAIGSVKSNIGHLEAAAGMAGLTKILLQMKHTTLVPSLHADPLNEDIDFAATPFVVQKELATWPNSQGPRCAMLSSFGAGGSNAHAIVQEFHPERCKDPSPPSVALNTGEKAIVPLSARTADRLPVLANQLIAYLEDKATRVNLTDLAYTLQTGREPLLERLVFLVESLDELFEKLKDFVTSDTSSQEGVYRGNAKLGKKQFQFLYADSDIKQIFQKWVDHGESEKIANLWANGLSVDWSRLYSRPRPQRVRLPKYPFARERYWMREVKPRKRPDSGEKRRKDVTRSVPMPALVSKNLPRISLPPVEVKHVAFPSLIDKPNALVLRARKDALSAPQLSCSHHIDLPVENAVISSPEPEARKALETVPVAAEKPEALREELSISLAKALYMRPAEVKPDDAFVNMGLDSIIGVEWIQTLNTQYGLCVAATRLYDYPNIHALAEFLTDEMARSGPAVSGAEPIATNRITDPFETEVNLSPHGKPAPERGALQADLTASLAKALYVNADDIDMDTPFVDLGLDSIISVEWIREVNQKYGLSIEATRVYDYPDIRRITRFITREIETNATDGDCPRPVSAKQTADDSGDLEIPSAPPTNTGVAVIGMSCRFPQSKDCEAFWEVLKNGTDCITEVPVDRWSHHENWYHPDPEHTHTAYSKWGGFLDDIDKFDPLFFNISPMEAEAMDPQQRIFLEETWKTIESAGYNPRELGSQSCGVYVGCTTGDYVTALSQNRQHTLGEAFTGTSSAILASRISYFLDLKGPSLAIDTACSSSLAAVHLACESIRHGENRLAIAGGINLFVTPWVHILTSQVGMQAINGRCCTFDEAANGTVFSEGCGVVLLKALDKAQKDGDPIIGVIKGSGINQDGKTNGITAPSALSQEALITGVYRKFDIDPNHISYVEAHGTATKLGDPLEVQAISRAFESLGAAQRDCAMGSVKTNIGHGAYAAGIAGLIKVLLCLKNKKLVPSLHFNKANPHIDFARTPFYVNTEYKDWPVHGTLSRRAVVSSFGFSGTNAHLVVEQGPAREGHGSSLTVRRHPPDAVIVPISAKNKERLRAATHNLLVFLQKQIETEPSRGRITPAQDSAFPSLSDIAYTLQVGREAMDARVAFVANDAKELIAKLEAYLENVQPLPDCYQGHVQEENPMRRLFDDDEDLAETVERWIRKRKTAKLLNWWVKGGDIEWSRWYEDALPCRLGLPTYPFARERYWVQGMDGPAGEAASRGRQPVDLEENRQAMAFETIWRENQAASGTAVLHAGNQIHVPRQAPVQSTPGTSHCPFKSKGTYLITGGCSPIGYRIAEHLLKRVGARLIITGPSALSNEQQTQFKALEEAGGIFSYLEADLNSPEQMQKELTIAQKAMGPICGMFHISDLTPWSAIQDHPGEAIQMHLAENARPLATLDMLCAEKTLDFCCAVSCAPPPSDPWGECAHRIGHQFWSTWASLENELSDRKSCLRYAIDWRLAPPEQPSDQAWAQLHAALTLFEQLLAEQRVQTVVRLQTEGAQETAQAAEAAFDNALASVKPADSRATPPLSLAQEKLTDLVLQDLKENVHKLFKIDPDRLDVNANLAVFGFNSINLTSFARQLSEQYRIEITPAVLFGYHTLTQLADFLLTVHSESLHQHYAGHADGSAPTDDSATACQPSVAPPGYDGPAELAGTVPEPSEPLAIIGMSCNFPKAENPNVFWDNLKAGLDCITEVPKHRWDWRKHGADMQGTQNGSPVKWGGFINGIGDFDPHFFEIPPQEAVLMDPQQRLLLTYAYLAIEDAGYAPKALSGSKTGVFIGTRNSGYKGLLERAGMSEDAYKTTGILSSIGPNRLSYFLDLHGPSEPVETACASSLVAIKRAMMAIGNGSCDMAIVGGINTIVTPLSYGGLIKEGLLSADGRCKPFAAAADGFVRSEGVGLLVLKKLSRAEEDRDHIYGLIRSCTVSHGGRSNMLTAPNPVAQAELITSAYRQADIDPRTITYIEAHGTGTALGDCIEIDALKNAFDVLYRETETSSCIDAGQVQPGAHCALGAVKSNIGHTELASGVAGVIKVLLQIKHKSLVKSLHCEKLNPHIRLDDSPFYVVHKNRPWKRLTDKSGRPQPRRAGVSAFALGGVNTHIVLEEYLPAPDKATQTMPLPHLLVFSAADPTGLERVVKGVLCFVQAQIDLVLPDFAYTLQVGRDHLSSRLALVVKNRSDVIAGLQQFLDPTAGSYTKPFFKGDLHAGDAETRNLLSGSAGRDFADRLVEEKNLGKLAHYWVKGGEIPWEALHAGSHVRRMALPTYPFTKDRYWVADMHPDHFDLFFPSGSNPDSLPDHGASDIIQIMPHNILVGNCEAGSANHLFESWFT